jgi:CheY-like chemotaxis protein
MALSMTRRERSITMLERTILVVEDDFVQRRQIARVLLAAGYNVSEASEGLEAIRILHAQETDLVLTDIRMPCLDGISLLKYIKIFFRQIPVVIITAYPEATEDLKPDALLCKPFGEKELIAWVQRLIKPPSHEPPFQG